MYACTVLYMCSLLIGWLGGLHVCVGCLEGSRQQAACSGSAQPGRERDQAGNGRRARELESDSVGPGSAGAAESLDIVIDLEIEHRVLV